MTDYQKLGQVNELIGIAQSLVAGMKASDSSDVMALVLTLTQARALAERASGYHNKVK